ncbi:hypothetical protein [Nocardioides flavescens]|uniref:Uncharacterized protein n=1 Tax=Nocardioides flavescens TaxID=2691959 RepID=A0A6L7ER89_9ACTN|nr:hypothetical protein [Nocardioides flavescens]MXG89190.1 hypothetical protein [Nocardioides flavescens]
MRLFGRRRPDEAEVAAAVSAAVGQPVAYNHLQYGAGALSGTLALPDLPAYAAALVTARDALRAELGDDAAKVVVYLSARTPGEESLDAAALGLPLQPTVRDLERLDQRQG